MREGKGRSGQCWIRNPCDLELRVLKRVNINAIAVGYDSGARRVTFEKTNLAQKFGLTQNSQSLAVFLDAALTTGDLKKR